MEINHATTWWIVCGLLVAVELGTGSFYLLMLALGCAAGALAAHLGLGGTAQTVAAALVGGTAVALWHLKRQRGGRPAPAQSNPDVSLDIGQRVFVEHWRADGSAQVRYRGADWQARFQGQGRPEPGAFVIQAIEGSQLLLDR
ncbi:membrane protein implicated in regulation of membrane protease activity [Paucibacter oligotrophus]|uniref:Membrane protein implicated in regulation of membrane protease activity n=1 Tax=Roseateles oligotrophus TaxID=1769250 RepID=A0A840LFU2_9BURK|nr:NfeD family protein [Roseateles oligotrophus]MBB4844167.1 membrane protein implicated in regulation of membrane protease activity [Roseateles oligotrophus]